jgi:hypothetical protein
VTRFASSIGIALTNKFLLSNYGFSYPVFLTLCHMLACTLMSSAAEAAGIVQPQTIKTSSQFRKIVAQSTAFLVSVALGNVSLRYIPVSFFQVHPRRTTYNSVHVNMGTWFLAQPSMIA